MKNVLMKSLFFQNWPAIFLLCLICLLRSIWVLFLKQKVVHCVLSFDWSVLCLKVTCWCFCNAFEFFLCQALLVITPNVTISPEQKQRKLTLSYFFLWGIRPESSKVQSKLLWLKNYHESVKMHKIDDSSFIFIV